MDFVFVWVSLFCLNWMAVICVMSASGYFREMKFHVLAFDYDGTLAHDGKVSNSTLEALERAVSSGRKLDMRWE